MPLGLPGNPIAAPGTGVPQFGSRRALCRHFGYG